MALPHGFVESLQSIPSFHREAFEAAHQGESPVSLRYSRVCREVKEAEGAVQVPWAQRAFTLSKRPLFVADPLWHAGAYYVQEASSMFLDYVMLHFPKHEEPQVWLDMCAAPGGKSLILCDHLNEKDVLVSNEVIATRNAVLRENLVKWGNSRTVLTRSEASAFSRAGACFDLVLADVPCSGSGLFRREPALAKNWSRENVLFCADRQKKLLHELLPLVRNGGYLVYATCSFSSEENEDILDYLAAYYSIKGVEIPIQKEWGIVSAATPVSGLPCYRFWPDRLQGEGFFMAVLQVENDSVQQAGRTATGKSYTSALPASARKGFSFFRDREQVIISTAQAAAWQETFASKIEVRQWGLPVFDISKGMLQPLQGLATGGDCHHQYPTLELDLTEATAYLARQVLPNQQGLSGYVQLQYQGIALGFGKAVEKRINNLYPHAWRIRKHIDWL